MTRARGKVASRRRHKRVLKQTKGFWGQRKNIFRRASETLRRAWAFAFKGRKLKKRNMRALFITRISAAAVSNGTSYNRFIHGLKKADIQLNRKMLSQLAIFEPEIFTKLIVIAKG